MVTPLHIIEIDSAILKNKLFFVLSNRTHQTEMITILPNTKAMAQLVKNKNSYSLMLCQVSRRRVTTLSF